MQNGFVILMHSKYHMLKTDTFKPGFIPDTARDESSFFAAFFGWKFWRLHLQIHLCGTYSNEESSLFLYNKHLELSKIQ